MADTKALKEFRRALADAHRLADFASTAAFRARQRATALAGSAARLYPSIGSESMRGAIAKEIETIGQEAMQAENDSYTRRHRLLDLLELLGG